jgi:uncharacterized protein YggE
MSRAGTILGAVGLALLAVVLVLQLMAVLPGRVAPATVGEEPRGITVMAQGKASAEPDLAMITIGVETRDSTATLAAEENNDRMADVMDALRAVGVAEEDIQTIDYSIRAEIDWDDDEHRVIGYVVTNSVLVKMRDMDKVGDVLDAVTEAGANNIYGIQFTFDDPAKLREQARAEAMAEARKKAEALAQLAGVRLGSPRQISESSTESAPYYLDQMYSTVERAVGGGGASVSPGQLEVTVQVQVTYDIG